MGCCFKERKYKENEKVCIFKKKIGIIIIEGKKSYRFLKILEV